MNETTVAIKFDRLDPRKPVSIAWNDGPTDSFGEAARSIQVLLLMLNSTHNYIKKDGLSAGGVMALTYGLAQARGVVDAVLETLDHKEEDHNADA